MNQKQASKQAIVSMSSVQAEEVLDDTDVKCYCQSNGFFQRRASWQIVAAEVHAEQFALFHAVQDKNIELIKWHMENNLSFLDANYPWTYHDDMHNYRQAARQLFRTYIWSCALDLNPEFEHMRRVDGKKISPKMWRTYFFNRGHKKFDDKGRPLDQREWWTAPRCAFELTDEKLQRLPRFKIHYCY
jgi:hypothetical protein